MAKGKKGAGKPAAKKSAKKDAAPKGEERPGKPPPPSERPGTIPAEQSKPATEDQKSLAVGDARAMQAAAGYEGPVTRARLHSVDLTADPPTISLQGAEGRQAGGAIEVSDSVELYLNGQEPNLGLEDLRRGDELVIHGEPGEPPTKIEATRRG